MIQLIILALDAAGILSSLVSPTTATFLNPMLRPLLFVAMSRSVRRSFGSFLLVLPAVSDALFLGGSPALETGAEAEPAGLGGCYLHRRGGPP